MVTSSIFLTNQEINSLRLLRLWFTTLIYQWRYSVPLSWNWLLYIARVDQTAKNSYLGIWFYLDESLCLVMSLHLDCECDWGKGRILLKKVICAGKDSSTISWAEELNFVVKEWLRFSFLILCHQSCNDSNAVQLGNHFAPGLPQCVCHQTMSCYCQ